MQVFLALTLILTVVELFFAACAAVVVAFSSAFNQSVLFRVHGGLNIVSEFLLKVGGNSASCSIAEIIPVQELCDVNDPSRLNKDVATREKREKETAKKSGEAKDKSYEDYSWFKRCEDVTKLEKVRVPEQNMFLNHHGLKQHLKRSKSGKGKAILRHSCLQQKSLVIAGQPTLRNTSTLTQNGNRASADSSETDESDKNEYENDAIDSGAEYESCDVVLAFINSDE